MNQPSSNTTTLAEWMDKLNPSPEALSFMPRDLALETGIVPLYFKDDTLVVAAAEPVNIQKLSAMQFTLGRRIGLVRVPRAALTAAMRMIYGQVAVPEVNRLVDAVNAPQELRRLPQVRQVFEPGSMQPRIVAISSGKGGVGKTTFAANLAVSLSLLGLRVGMVDCDFGLANLHLAMGIKPEFTLADVVLSGRDAIGCMTSGFTGVKVLAGSDGFASDTEWNYSTLRSAGCGFELFKMHFDFTIIDTAAGVHESVTSSLEAADQVIMVITPDPSSVHDAYVTTRTLLERKPHAQIDVVINQSLSDGDARLMFAKFQSTLSQSMGGQVRLLGIIPWEKTVIETVRARVPYVLIRENSLPSQAVMNMARNLTGLDAIQSTHTPIWKRAFARS